MPDFNTHPGYWFVLATILPLASFLVIFLASGLWCIARRYREAPGMEGLYQATGGDTPGMLPAFVATGAIALAFACSLTGFIHHFKFQARTHHVLEDSEHEIRALRETARTADKKEAAKLEHEIEEKEKVLA